MELVHVNVMARLRLANVRRYSFSSAGAVSGAAEKAVPLPVLPTPAGLPPLLLPVPGATNDLRRSSGVVAFQQSDIAYCIRRGHKGHIRPGGVEVGGEISLALIIYATRSCDYITRFAG